MGFPFPLADHLVGEKPMEIPMAHVWPYGVTQATIGTKLSTGLPGPTIKATCFKLFWLLDRVHLVHAHFVHDS